MRKRIGIYGASDEALPLLPCSRRTPTSRSARVFDPDPEAARERLRSLERGLARALERAPDLGRRARWPRTPASYAVIDASPDASFAARFPAVSERGVQVVTPLMARLLWGYGGATRDRKAELLQALHEVVESVQPDDRRRRAVRAHARDRARRDRRRGRLADAARRRARASCACASRRASSPSCGRRSACGSARASPDAWRPRAARCACAARPIARASGSCASGSTSSRRSACRWSTRAACSAC